MATKKTTKKTTKKPIKKTTRKTTKKTTRKTTKKTTKRVKDIDRITYAWDNITDTVWPPNIKDRVRVFKPKAMRGELVKVIATPDDKLPISSRIAPKGKVRVFSNRLKLQFSVSKEDVVPSDVKIKDLRFFDEFIETIL